MTIAAAEMSTAMSSSLGEDEFLLKWHDHHQSFFLLVEELVAREQLTDVTLACGGEIVNGRPSVGSGYTLLSAHSLMLSVCSPYFRTLLSENRHKEKHHIIHLHGVSAKHMQQLLWYMYRGELSICQEDLAPLIETARCLQIKGLAMAATPPPAPAPTPFPLAAKKRSFSQMLSNNTETSSTSYKPSKQPNNALSRALVPASPIQQEFGREEEEEGALVVNTDYEEQHQNEYYKKVRNTDYEEQHQNEYYNKVRMGVSPHGGNNLSPVSLPLLPKPLSVLKTAETRTYLSKLVWLGNGGKRPQYGNPETKPCWWPQHILPWEDMKKMGGRKSAELTNINYTEVLKQCLAAGYEYFGYDPATYFSTEVAEVDNSFMVGDKYYQGGGGVDSFTMDDGHYPKGGGYPFMDNSHGFKESGGDSIMKMDSVLKSDNEFMEEEEEDMSRQEGVLEIDLDAAQAHPPRVQDDGEQNQILCK